MFCGEYMLPALCIRLTHGDWFWGDSYIWHKSQEFCEWSKKKCFYIFLRKWGEVSRNVFKQGRKTVIQLHACYIVHIRYLRRFIFDFKVTASCFVCCFYLCPISLFSLWCFLISWFCFLMVMLYNPKCFVVACNISSFLGATVLSRLCFKLHFKTNISPISQLWQKLVGGNVLICGLYHWLINILNLMTHNAWESCSSYREMISVTGLILATSTATSLSLRVWSVIAEFLFLALWGMNELQ